MTALDAKAPRKQHVIILGQPRSGTVIFWKTLRQDQRFLCFNEPFHPYIRHHAERGIDHAKKTMGEYADYPELVAQYWSTIQPYEELYTSLLAHQRVYVRELLDRSENTCLKVIRCCAKLRDLRSVAPDALLVHLVRDPRAWVTSHLRPYGKWLPGLPERFFVHDGGFNFWSRQQMADYLGMDGLAHEKLLRIWSGLTDAAEDAGPDLTIQFEHFAHDPERIMRRIYGRLNIEYRDLDYANIRRPNEPFERSHPAWESALKRNTSPRSRRFIFDFDAQQLDASGVDDAAAAA